VQIIALLIDQEFGVTDDVDEEDVTYLKPNVLFRFGGHSGSGLNYASFIIYSTCRCREQRGVALLFRRLRGREFLEARIIPQRIEHRIEPEQLRGERHVFGESP
jgi:hypothetical protein